MRLRWREVSERIGTQVSSRPDAPACAGHDSESRRASGMSERGERMVVGGC